MVFFPFRFVLCSFFLEIIFSPSEYRRGGGGGTPEGEGSSRRGSFYLAPRKIDPVTRPRACTEREHLLLNSFLLCGPQITALHLCASLGYKSSSSPALILPFLSTASLFCLPRSGRLSRSFLFTLFLSVVGSFLFLSFHSLHARVSEKFLCYRFVRETYCAAMRVWVW